MKALIFGSKQAYKLARTYTTKTGDEMVVVPMLLLETGGLVEQHFTVSDFKSLNVSEDMYFSSENQAVVELTTETRGMSNKIIGISLSGVLDYKVLPFMKD